MRWQCNNRVALAGPKRRGRKVGSGQGEKRKNTNEYSTNQNTLKSRKRVAKMNKYEKEINRAQQTESSWISKRISKWKKSGEFQSIPTAKQDQAIKTKRKELRQER